MARYYHNGPSCTELANTIVADFGETVVHMMGSVRPVNLYQTFGLGSVTANANTVVFNSNALPYRDYSFVIPHDPEYTRRMLVGSWEDRITSAFGIPRRLMGAIPEEYERQRQTEEQTKKPASETARKLLLSRLTPVQKRQLEERKAFLVRGSQGGLYLIRAIDYTQNIYAVRKGCLYKCWCFHIDEVVPLDDHLLAQKLLLETDERAALKLAHRSELGGYKYLVSDWLAYELEAFDLEEKSSAYLNQAV